MNIKILTPLILIILSNLFLPRFLATETAQPGSSHAKWDMNFVGNVASLEVAEDGGIIHLLLGQEIGDGENREFTLHHTRSEDAGRTWSHPTRVDRNSEPVRNPKRSMDPQIAVSGDNLISLWRIGGTGRRGSGPLVSAVSDDGGKTWRSGGRPSDLNDTSSHGFADIRADKRGNFHVVWLDNRDDNARGLRYASSSDNGESWTPNKTVDEKTCGCCWNAVEISDAGSVYALYRDVEPRDMNFARLAPGDEKWQKLGPVGGFSWDFQGCPHVGGAIAIQKRGENEEIHNVVWTGKKENEDFYYLRSSDGGEGWSKPRKFGGPSAKHGDIAVNEKGHLAIVWDEFVQNKRAIFLSTSRDSGTSWSEPRRVSLPGKETVYPRVVAVKNEFHAYWTESSKENKSTWKSTSF